MNQNMQIFSDDDHGLTTLIGRLSRLEEDFEVSWLKKSRRVLAFTSPDIMFMSSFSITFKKASIKTSVFQLHSRHFRLYILISGINTIYAN